MPLNGSGIFSRAYNWTADKLAGIKISSTRMDDEMNGMASALSLALYRDGQASPTADMNWGGQKLKNLGDPVDPTDAVNLQTADQRYGTSTAVRLTLASGVAVTQSDIAGAGTIYLTPDGSNTIGIYSGLAWVARVFAEVALQLDATGHTSNSNFDVFAYWDGAAVKVGTAPAWASNTTRGIGSGTSELEMFLGRLVNKYPVALRNGGLTVTTLPARRGLLVGGFRVGAVAGQTEDSNARRFLSNVYGRTARALKRVESAVSWTYQTSTWRQANGNVANQFEIFDCLGDLVTAQIFVTAINSTSSGRSASVGIGLDSTTQNLATLKSVITIANAPANLSAYYEGYPGLGYHTIAWLEWSGTLDTRTFYGDASSLGVEHQSGMIGQVFA